MRHYSQDVPNFTVVVIIEIWYVHHHRYVAVFVSAGTDYFSGRWYIDLIVKKLAAERIDLFR